jgi:hypothetical protein
MPCSQVVFYRRFGGVYFLYIQSGRVSRESKKQAKLCLLGLLFDPEDGGSTFFRNVGECLPDCMTSYLKMQYLSQTWL